MLDQIASAAPAEAAPPCPAHLDPATGGPVITASDDGRYAFVSLYSRFGRFRAFVDAADAPIVDRHLWHALRDNSGKLWPVTTLRIGGRYFPLSMARVILRPARGFTVAHLNGSPLDCRRSNLEIRKASRSRGGIAARRKREAAARRKVELGS